MTGKRVPDMANMMAAVTSPAIAAATAATDSSAHNGRLCAQSSQPVATAVSRALALMPPPRLNTSFRLSSFLSRAPTPRPSRANSPSRGAENSPAQKIRPSHGLGMKNTVPRP